MLFRTHRSILALTVTFLLGCLSSFAAESPEQAAAEAERLYSRANDYVQNITENGYSYAYIQFYWKRAQSNIDRIVRVYPQTPVGRKLLSDELKLGNFETAYFKERVLPRLETKRLAAFDAVNCAIFLYNLDEQRWDEERLAALTSIVEVLARQQRWNEALSFPVRDQDKDLLFTTVFRVAARYMQDKLVQELIENARPELQAQYWPILAEAMVLTGQSREELTAFLKEHDSADTRLAALSAMVDREVAIQRAALRREDVKKGIQKVHFSILNLDVRDDIEQAARTLFPQPTAQSQAQLARYRSALGQRPAARGGVEEHNAYLEHLALTQNYEELERYVERLPGPVRQVSELKLIELQAEEGRLEEAARLREAVSTARPTRANDAALAEFRGRMLSNENPLTVRETTFRELSITDGLVLAQAIMDWSLTPNRSIRGPSPYDSVVHKFLPGFENLPLPESDEVGAAASTSKPF